MVIEEFARRNEHHWPSATNLTAARSQRRRMPITLGFHRWSVLAIACPTFVEGSDGSAAVG